MSDPVVAQMVEEGIAAAKAGDKGLARGKLETALKMDEDNEQAWFYLATVVETDDERRTCLGNVLILNPQNERARKMMDKLEGRVAHKEAVAADTLMGMPRRTAYMVFGILGLIVLLLLVLFSVLSGGGDEIIVPTQISTKTPTSTPDEAQTATALASITPTLTLTPVPTIASAANVATWTPTAGPTATNSPEPLPTFPPELVLPGRIIMQSGRLANDAINQSIVVVMLPDVTSRILVSPENTRGQNPVLSPGGNQFAWAQYVSATRNYTLMLQSVGSPTITNISSIFNNEVVLDKPNEPTWFGNAIAFTAQQLGVANRDLWLLDVSSVQGAAAAPFGEQVPTATLLPTIDPLATPGELSVGSPLQRLTEGTASISDPMFDPTGTALVFASTENGITDLKVMNRSSQQIFALTQNENALVEAAPDWGTFNGTDEIIFSGTALGGAGSDIYLMPATGAAEPQIMFDYGPHDIRPRFSPDGRFIVFSSDKYGGWDVFIYVRETQQVFPLEANPATFDIANDWAQ